jgi:hypothetical protein
MGYAFNSAKSQLDKRTLGGFFPAPIGIPMTEDTAAILEDSILELGLPVYEGDRTTAYALEVDGKEVGTVRGSGHSWYFIDLAGKRSEKTYRSRKLSSNALALQSFAE